MKTKNAVFCLHFMEEKKNSSPIYAVVRLAAADQSPAYPEIRNNKTGGWVAFGNRNMFPQYLLNINSKSPVNAAILESKLTYVCGKGVRDTAAANSNYVRKPNPREEWDPFIEKIVRDFIDSGMLYHQVILNKDGQTVSLYHQDQSTVRVGKIDQYGTPLTMRIANDWTKTGGNNKPLELEVWPGVEDAKVGQPYIDYYWSYIPGMKFYSLPDWYAAIEYVKADGSLGVFYNNSIDNGFSPSVIISMPGNAEDEQKEAFQKGVESAYSGPNGASTIMTLWGEGDVLPQVNAFDASHNADIYNSVEGIIFQKIISAHRLSSPTLAGVSGSGNLSGNASEIVDAFILYNYTVIEKIRRTVLDHLNKYAKINGDSKLEIQELDVVGKIRESEASIENIQVQENQGSATLGVDQNVSLSVNKKAHKSVLAMLYKYIRKEPKPGGGYRYIYEEPKERGSKKKLKTSRYQK